MRAEQRWRVITGWLEEAGRLDVAQTASRLSVAPETVRRDLRRLESAGRLQRVHGGAVRVEPEAPELPPVPCWPPTAGEAGVEESWALDLWQRLRCLSTIVLGSGSMVVALARAIVAEPPTPGGLTLVSGSLDASLLLAPVAGLTVFHVGGAAPTTGESQGYPVTGSWAVAELSRIQADVSVVGPAGIHLERGLSEPGTGAAALGRAQLRAGRRRIALADERSLGSAALVTVVPLAEVDELVLAAAPLAGAAGPLRAALRGGSGASRDLPEFL